MQGLHTAVPLLRRRRDEAPSGVAQTAAHVDGGAQKKENAVWVFDSKKGPYCKGGLDGPSTDIFAQKSIRSYRRFEQNGQRIEVITAVYTAKNSLAIDVTCSHLNMHFRT